MYLRRIIISNFKNIRSADLIFSRKINCISGNNGEGKTNLLDAVYYLSMTKSYFNSSDGYTFTFGENHTVINGSYHLPDGTEDKISVSVKSGGEKSIRKNEKCYPRISEHIGSIPIVMISPADTSLVNGTADERRKFLNSILSQVDKEYLRRVMRYNQMLVQRNKLLKMENLSFELLETIDERMSPDAAYIYNKRYFLSTRLQELIREFYSKLSGGKEVISLKYISDLQDFITPQPVLNGKSDLPSDDVVSTKATADDSALVSLFSRSAQRDAVMHYTTAGIHRDDVDFKLGDHPIKRCGSQGQQKCFLIALKLAQFTLMKELHGSAPILLLDDVFDKLDMQRVEYLLGLVASDQFGQIFITDSNKVRMSKIANSVTNKLRSFEVVSGNFRELTND